MMVDQIIKGLVIIAVALITGFLIPWIKSKLSADQLNKLIKWAKIAVEAAEMIYDKSGMGKDKKSYVIEFLHNILISLKVEVSEEELNNIIEAAVLELKRGA